MAAFLTPALGFASNLSHTIIRETQEDEDRSFQSHESSSTTISITDEELALLGAPWAKEGMLCRKQYWESAGKRAKSKSWLDVFVVIQRGELNMFTFGEHGGGGSGIVGGGNWLVRRWVSHWTRFVADPSCARKTRIRSGLSISRIPWRTRYPRRVTADNDLTVWC